MERKGRIKDLDLWIGTDTANATATYKALKSLGAPFCLISGWQKKTEILAIAGFISQ